MATTAQTQLALHYTQEIGLWRWNWENSSVGREENILFSDMWQGHGRMAKREETNKRSSSMDDSPSAEPKL